MDLHQHGYGHHAIVEPEDELNVFLDQGLLTIEIHNSAQQKAVAITIDADSAQLIRFRDEMAKAAKTGRKPLPVEEVFGSGDEVVGFDLDINLN